jgi:hypothetical protein
MVSIPEKEHNSVVAIFVEHSAAESAFRALQKAGFAINKLTIVDQALGSNALRADLSGLDVSEDRLLKLEAAIKAGKSVLIAHGPDDEVVEAFELLQNSGAEDVRFHRPPGETARRVA